MRKRNPPMKPMYEVLVALVNPLPRDRTATKLERKATTVSLWLGLVIYALAFTVAMSLLNLYIGGDDS